MQPKSNFVIHFSCHQFWQHGTMNKKQQGMNQSDNTQNCFFCERTKHPQENCLALFQKFLSHVKSFITDRLTSTGLHQHSNQCIQDLQSIQSRPTVQINLPIPLLIKYVQLIPQKRTDLCNQLNSIRNINPHNFFFTQYHKGNTMLILFHTSFSELV